MCDGSKSVVEIGALGAKVISGLHLNDASVVTASKAAIASWNSSHGTAYTFSSMKSALSGLAGGVDRDDTSVVTARYNAAKAAGLAAVNAWFAGNPSIQQMRTSAHKTGYFWTKSNSGFYLEGLSARIAACAPSEIGYVASTDASWFNDRSFVDNSAVVKSE